jgi:hypothetical protein
MRRIRFAVTAAVVVLVAAAAASAVRADDPSRESGQAKRIRQLIGVNFVSTCGFSHRAGDDPIVFPGFPGLSHDHSFVGNVSTNAFSTLSSLRAAGTTCRRQGDTAAYWMPTLLVNGSVVEPLGATVYYRRHTLAPTQPFPAGLQVVAGDAHATAAQDPRVVFWNCGVESGIAQSSMPPTCPGGRAGTLRLHVSFPDCWNGRNVQSADHHSHMAYSQHGACPRGYPVPVPAITVIFRYPSMGGPMTTLASGGPLTGHADFFNAWNQSALNRLVTTCLDAFRHCGRGV